MDIEKLYVKMEMDGYEKAAEKLAIGLYSEGKNDCIRKWLKDNCPVKIAPTKNRNQRKIEK